MSPVQAPEPMLSSAALPQKAFSIGGLVQAAQAVQTAADNFQELIVEPPNRPPLPCCAAPADWRRHRKAPPDDATCYERWRDSALLCGTSRSLSYVLAAWMLSFVVVDVLLVLTVFYWFNGGYTVDEFYGCVPGIDEPTPKFFCNATSGALTYSVDDFWQERFGQALSIIFTFSVVLATPWRLSILRQITLNTRARSAGKVGVDFYGRPSDFVFFHIPVRGRCIIGVALNVNTLIQLVHQGLHGVWSFVEHFRQPQSTILLLTGPVAGTITGGIAGAVQIYYTTRLHESDPEKFPPTIVNTLYDVRRLRRQGEAYRTIWRMLRGKGPKRRATEVPEFSDRARANHSAARPAAAGAADGSAAEVGTVSADVELAA